MRERTQFSIDLSILSQNFEKLKILAPKNKVLFMVKANGYGHGMIPIVQYSFEHLGINEFGVATLGEALALRDALGQYPFDIYVFSDVQIELETHHEKYLNRRIIPVLSGMKDFEFFLSNDAFTYFPLCLKFNTGMNRLGLSMESLPEIIKKLKGHGRKEIFHLITHFACISGPADHKLNLEQIKNFEEIKRTFKNSGINLNHTSISNSGAIEQGVGLENTHIRPGLMLYGPSSMARQYAHLSNWNGQCIGRLDTYVIRIFKVNKGDPIGYGGTLVPRDGYIAIIALGYGDGFSTKYQSVKLQYKDRSYEVFGRVNMDMAQLFIDERSCPLKEGDHFTIWGHDPEDVLNICQQMNSIPYELFCQLSVRIPREYRI